MSHQITFNSVYNHWNNALPLGNGKMGAMVFFKDHALHIALNHYDCYYPNLGRYANNAQKPRRKTYQDLCRMVDEARAAGADATSHYLHTLYPASQANRPGYKGTSFPMAGEIVIKLCPSLTNFTLSLVIEEGVVLLDAKSDSRRATAKIWVAKTADGLFAELNESETGLWGDAALTMPGDIGMDAYQTAQGTDGTTLWQRTAIRNGEFAFETAVTSAIYSHDSQTPSRCVAASVAPVATAGEVAGAAPGNISRNQKLLDSRPALATAHATAWAAFWRTSVKLPDYFLETLWHLHLYLMECASGKDGKYIEQACGLNGLWDIRRPSLWGSMWYWDVNIQEAFWAVFSSNKLELGKLFCDAYLRHQDDIKAYTKDVYGIDGWALDYPHTLYHCIQPWCTQFLWQYYQYSGDADFLKNTAYPVFQKQIAFFKQVAVPGEDGKLHMNYDISPEQGPISKDSVITIASIKWLLKYAIQSAEILDRPQGEKDEFERLLDRLPDYAVTSADVPTPRWKDSALAPDNLFLRHPSVLMPIFPAEEVSKNSPEAPRTLARNTLKFAMENTEMGVFGFGWLACAAARMGEGAAALRILYEQGVDNIIHSNGMGYEESERFINHCLITKMPLYPPAMTEPSGGIVMTVNMMMLQTFGDCIEVFPAVPDGQDRLTGSPAQYNYHRAFLSGAPAAWEDCAFESMLAPGGFEISAKKQGGDIVWIKVVSLRGGKLKLKLPAALAPGATALTASQIAGTLAAGEGAPHVIVEQTMLAGETLEFGSRDATVRVLAPQVQVRDAAHTRRRVFLGENRHTAFYKAVDSFTCAYVLGNAYQYTMTPYVFDFGMANGGKNYDDVYPKHFSLSGKALVFFGAPVLLGAAAYDKNLGYGFNSAEGLLVADRGAPDSLRRDFVAGTSDNEFGIELPRGKYNLLLISGDETEASQTHISIPHLHGKIAGEVMPAGRYQCRVVPFMHEEDGVFKIGLSTEAGRRWALNGLFLSKEYVL